MEERVFQLLKVVFYSAVSVMLVAFTVFNLVQGILLQISADFRMALIFYFVSGLAGATLSWTYYSARRAFAVLK